VNSHNITRESTCPIPACYRLGPQYLILGIVCLTFFLAIGIGSVYVAYWNIDGSFGRPKLAALGFGVFWSFWVLLALWLIVAFFRERLFVTPNAITQQGCIRKRTINSTDVIQIVWKRFPQGGSVIVRSHFTRIKIYLSNFTRDEQNQLIAYLREMYSPAIHENWTRFIEARLQAVSEHALRKSRGAASICALLLFSFASIFGYCWLVGLGVQWLIVALLNALGGAWYVWRIVKFQDQPSTERPA
jgi:hypothetical protein